ncbi:MAG: hypothetical protein MJZ74_03390 [Muribaculaceae bacterium]|nr:hypothetical protein [Muribaculaceae bacterium]
MTKLVTIFSVVSLLLLVVACKTSKAPVNNSGNSVATGSTKIVYLEYTERATYAQPIDYFKVELKDNGTVKIHRQQGMHEEDLTADASLMDDLLSVYVNGKVSKWKSDYQPPMEVLDGYSWRLEVKFADGSYKYSHGSNARPESNALEEFSKLIWKLKK